MEFRKGLIEFKSLVIPFIEERSGRKNNTIRIMSTGEFNKLARERVWAEHERTPGYKIRISLKDGSKFFERTITDISVVGDIAGQKLVVFSWKHEEE